ncbi:MAG: hypothetical protein AB7S98_22855, partial [Burkholderiaceae bacterium]
EAQNNSNDCDNDTFIEPIGAGPAIAGLTGGGRLPSVGATANDPWGSPYGYCAWNHGTDVTSNCSGGTTPLLRGHATGQGTVIAVLSAGPDRQFGSTCVDNPAPNAPYITRGVNGADDLIVSMTYSEANEASGGLWSISSTDPDAITTNRSLDVSTGAQFSSGDVGFTNTRATFGTGSALDFTGGGLFMLPNECQSASCGGPNKGLLRRFTGGICPAEGTQEVLQICDGASWQDIGGSGAIVAAAGNPGEIQYNAAGVMGASSSLVFNSSNGLTVGGDSIFSSDLRVNQTLRVTNALNVTGNSTLTGALDVDGSADFDSTIDVALGATFGSWLRGSDGTAGAPTYSFTGDSDSGIFFSSNALRFSIDGTERMALSAGGLTMTAGHALGNFTVDGTLTTNDLSVSNNITANRFISRMAATSATQPAFETEPGTGMYSAVDNTLSLVAGGTPRIVIDGTGDVGIGVLSPEAKLDVGGEIKVGTSSLGCGPTLHGAIRYVSGDLLQVCSSVTGIWEDIGTSGGGGGGAASYWTRISSVDRRLYYDDAFVGVGTNNPLDDFHVAGDLLVTGGYTGTPSIGVSGAGARMFYDPEGAVFRGGIVTGNQWDSTNLGLGSFAWGYNAQASGDSSFVIGTDATTTPAGPGATALGREVVADGLRATAWSLGDATGAFPRVSGAESFGVFMGDQSGVNLAQAGTMALLGGRFLIDSSPPANPAVSGTLSLDVEGGVGAMQYCDENGVNCFTAASVATGGVAAPGNNRELIYNSGGVLGANPNMVFSSAGNLVLGGTGALGVPVGTDMNRPALPIDGMLRYNSATSRFEGYQAGGWADLITGRAVAAGASTQIQFNSNGALAASPMFTFHEGELRVDGTDHGKGGVVRIRGAESPAANFLDATMILESMASSSLWSQTLVSNIPSRNGDLVFAHFNGSVWTEPLILADDGRIGIFSTNPRASLDINTTDAILLPTGNVGNRPASPVDGMLRYNAQSGKFEGFQQGTWQDILTPAVTGGAASPNRGIQFNSNGSFGASGEFQYTSGGSFLLTGTHTGTGDTTLPTGAGTRMFFDPTKSAFRAGAVTTGQWNFTSVGEFSAAFGRNTVASGQFSFAAGLGSVANGDYSVAMGSSANASAVGSMAFGMNAIASAQNSKSLGWNTLASGNESFAAGYATTASGYVSMAMGAETTASNISTVALGRRTTASGPYSWALGQGAVATRDNSGAIGFGSATGFLPSVDAARAFGLFFGDQSGVTMPNPAAQNTMGIFGGKLVIDPRVPALQTTARSVLDLGAATDALVLPRGSTAQQPSGVDGMIRYNSQTQRFEGHQAGAWQDLVTIGSAPGAATPNRGVQFNSGGSFAASSNFLWHDDLTQLRIGDIVDTLPELMIGRTTADAHLRLQGQEGQNNALLSMVSNTTSNLWQLTMKGDSSPNPDALAFENYHDADNSWHGPIAFAGSNGFARIGLNTYAPNVSLDIRATDAIQIPAGSTAQQPAGANGMLRYNSQTDRFEGFQAGAWQDIVTGAAVGGAASPNRAIQFNSNGSFAATADLLYTSTGTFVISGTYAGTGSEPVSGAGTRMFFDPVKSAFRAGRVSGAQWNYSSVGNYSVAMGRNTVASGGNSTALGQGSIASGSDSVATGQNTVASGSLSTALGYAAVASGSV